MSDAALHLDLRASEAYCGRLAREEAANFYWGFIALPRRRRVAIYSLYDFARQVDDEADAHQAAHLAERLDLHRERLRKCLEGDFTDPVMRVLAGAIQRHSIPEEELQAVIRGVEMDFQRTRYQTWEELRAYCLLVASAVGRMCVRIFGFTDPAALEHADDLGLAMQLTNILRDVKEDAGLGRIYLPLADLERFGVTEDGVLASRPGSGWESLVRFEAERARCLFRSGLRVLPLVPPSARVCVGTMSGIYQEILARIEKDPWMPLSTRATLSKAAKIKVMLRSCAGAV